MSDRTRLAELAGICAAYCQHGGTCDLDIGHDGLHSAGGYCTFSDAEAVPRAVADAALLIQPGGSAALALIEGFEAMADD